MCSGVCGIVFPDGYWTELKKMMYFSLSLGLAQASQLLDCPITIMFCGRLNKTEFDGAVLAVVLICVLGLAFALGLSSACDTLFAQVYGSTSKHRLGIVLTKSLIFITPFVVLPIALFLNAENILISLYQSPDVARLTGSYLLIVSPGLIGVFMYLPLSKYLQNQNRIFPTIIIGLSSNIINVILNLILVVKSGYGLMGSAISLTSCYLSYPILTIAYIWISKVYEETWTGWSTECLMNWSQFWYLGWFGTAMTCFEWWSYEVGVLISGSIGNTELASQSIISQLSTYCLVLYIGVSLAANIRIGHLLGANDPDGASNSCKVVLTMTWLLSVTLCIVIYTLKNFIPLIFTNLPDVIHMTSSALPWYAAVCLFEGTFVVTGGIIRATGRQKLGSFVIFVSLVIGLSIGVPLMIRSRTINGFWQGLLIGIAIAAILLCTICFRTDWEKQALMALDRVNIATEEESPSDRTLLISDKPPHNVTSSIYVKIVFGALFILAIMVVSILVRMYTVYTPTKDGFNRTDNISYILNTTHFN